MTDEEAVNVTDPDEDEDVEEETSGLEDETLEPEKEPD